MAPVRGGGRAGLCSTRSPRRRRPRRSARPGAAGPGAGRTRRRTACARRHRRHRRRAACWARGTADRRLEMAALRAPRRRHHGRAAPADGRDRGAPRGGVRLAVRARRPAGRDRLREPAGGARGEPPAPGRRATRADAASPGARASASADGRAARSRRRSRPSRGTSATRTRWPPWSPSWSRCCGHRHAPGCSSGWSSSPPSCPRRRPVGLDGRRDRVAQALDLNRRSGFAAYARLLPRLRRLVRPAGRRPRRRALASVVEAVDDDLAVDHPWWYAWAAGLYAATLIEAGDARARRRTSRARGLAAPSPSAAPRPGGCAAWRALAARPTTRGTPRRAGAARRWTARPGRRLGRRAPTPTCWWRAPRGRAAATRRGRPAPRPAARRRRRTAWPPVRERVEQLRDQIRALDHQLSGAGGAVGRHRQVVHGLRPSCCHQRLGDACRRRPSA